MSVCSAICACLSEFLPQDAMPRHLSWALNFSKKFMLLKLFILNYHTFGGAIPSLLAGLSFTRVQG